MRFQNIEYDILKFQRLENLKPQKLEIRQVKESNRDD
jgi:hypothetical protein